MKITSFIKRGKWLCVLGVGLLSQGALAASFDFAGGSGTAAGSMQFTSGGITVTATPSSGQVARNSLEGLGVKANFFNLGGIQNNETLTLSFDQSVTIGGLTLRQWEGQDKAAVGYNSTTVTLDHDSCVFCSAESFTLGTGPLTQLTITGDSSLSVFFLTGLSNVEVSQVPLPGAVWLFGSGLLGLGAIRRRRRG